MGFMHSRRFSLCVAWVLSLCWYLVVFCMDFVGLLIFGCVLHGFYRFVDICLCVAWVLSFVDIWLCVAWVSSFC